MQRTANILIIVLITGFLLYIGAPLILPLIFGAFLAMLIQPFFNRLLRLIKLDWLAIILSFIIFIIPFLVIGYLLSSEIVTILEDLPSISDQLTSGLATLKDGISRFLPFLEPYELENVIKNPGNLLNKPLEIIGQGVISSTSGLVGLALTFLYAFFFLLYRHKFQYFLQSYFNTQKKDRVDRLVSKVKNMIQSYVIGLGLVILILCVLNSIGLYFIGIKYALLWGTMAGVLAIIPYIGTLIGGLLPFLFSLTTSEFMWQPIAVVIYYVVIQQIEGNIITPKVVGDQVNVNPLVSIIALLFFAQFWGLAGIILAIPMIAVIKIILDQFDSTKTISILLESGRSKPKGKSPDS